MSKNNATNAAKQVVKQYLEERAKADKLFAATYANPEKNIDGCWKYIMAEARKRGYAVCMTDAEVFGLAMHYYDEESVVAPESVAVCEVAVAQTAEPAEAPTPARESRPRAKAQKKPQAAGYLSPMLFDPDAL